MDLPSPQATPQPRRTIPSIMDDEKLAVALSWIEKCITIISTLSYSHVAAALMLLRFVRPAASFFLVLVGDFSKLAVVFLRIVARHAEIAAGALELVNETYFGRDAKNSSNDDVPTAMEVEEQLPKTPPRTHQSSLHQERNQTNLTVTDTSASASAPKKKEPEAKKAMGRIKIMELRQRRLQLGLKVASKADGCWD